MLTAFGVGFFYRVILPGIVAVTLLAPIRPGNILSWLGVSEVADRTAIFFLVVFAAGLILSSARHVIYYAAEGFYWHPFELWLRKRLTKKVTAKLTTMQALTKKRSGKPPSAGKDYLKLLHLNEFLSDFRISGESGRPKYVVERPTRIGNVIAAYEMYASDRYGVDGVFYWFHVRFSAAAGVQTELDRSEAVADGMVFCAAAAFVITIIYLVISIARLLGALIGIAGGSQLLLVAPASDGVLTVCVLASALAWAGFNRLAIYSLRAFGKQMRAAIDLYLPSVLKLSEPWLPNSTQKAALRIRRAYLKYGTSPDSVSPAKDSPEPKAQPAP